MNTDEQELQQLVTTWMNATKTGDTATVLSLMTDDVVFLQPGRPPMLGKAAFALAMNPPDAGTAPATRPAIDGTSEIQEVQIVGDLAYMWSRLKVVVTPADGGTPMIRAGHTLTIFRKQGGRWLLARDANLLAPVTSS